MISRKKSISKSIPESEVRLCEEFINRARLEGFQVYPEVSYWDIIIVNSDGVQLGVQAKLHANVDVLGQAIRGRLNGPKHRSVLVPSSTRRFDRVATALGLHVFTLRSMKLRRYFNRVIDFSGMVEWPGKPHWLPPVPSTCLAGSPSPRPLTRWRVAAIRLCIFLEEKGFLTGEDFKQAGINQSGWVSRGELKADGRVGRFTRYVAGRSDLPIVGFESEAEQIKDLNDEST